MGKWLIGLVLGLVALGGVYVLWRQQTASTSPSAVEVTQLPPPASASPVDRADAGTASAAAAPAPAPAPQASPGEGVIAVDDPWAKSLGSGYAECYMLFTNTSQIPDNITGVSSPDAAQALIQETVSYANGSRTRPAAHADLDPGVPLVFEPGSLHVALIGIKHPLKAGDAVTLVFTFAHASALTVKVPVGEQPALSDGIQP